MRFIDMYFNQNFEDFLEELFHEIIPDMVQNKLTPADPGIAKRMHDLDKKIWHNALSGEKAGYH